MFSLGFTACIVYLYTVAAFNYFNGFYPADNAAQCDTMWQCYAFHLNVGLRSGGGIGDALAPAKGVMELERFVFDLTFFFFVIVILLAIVQGQIIDTFSELRQKQDDIKVDDATRLAGLTLQHYRHLDLQFAPSLLSSAATGLASTALSL